MSQGNNNVNSNRVLGDLAGLNSLETNPFLDDFDRLDEGAGSFHQSMRTPPILNSPSSGSVSHYSDPGQLQYDSSSSFGMDRPASQRMARNQQLRRQQMHSSGLGRRKYNNHNSMMNQMGRSQQQQVGGPRRQDGVDEMFFNYLAFQLDCEDGSTSNQTHKKVHRVPPRVDKSRFPNSLYSHDLVVESLDEVFEIRPMSPDDDLRAQQFCRVQVAEEFKRSALLDKVPPKWSFTHVNYRRNFNMIAVSRRTDAIVGVAQYTRSNDSKATSGSIGGIVDLGVAVLTRYQAHGIGSHLLKSLADAAKYENDLVLRANFIPANVLAQKVFKTVMVDRVGAKMEVTESTAELITVVYRLKDSATVAANWEF